MPKPSVDLPPQSSTRPRFLAWGVKVVSRDHQYPHINSVFFMAEGTDPNDQYAHQTPYKRLPWLDEPKET